MLSPNACTSLAVVGCHQTAAAEVVAVAGEAFCVLVETQDALQQRICQVCPQFLQNVCCADAQPGIKSRDQIFQVD